MADLSKKDALELVDAVGALIDIQPTDSTTPSRQQIIDWLNEGAFKVFRFVPLNELTDSYINDTKIGNAIAKSDLSKKLLRIVELNRTGVACNEISRKEFSNLFTIDKLRYSSNEPVYVLGKVAGVSTFSVFPVAQAYLEIIYVPYPFMYVLPVEGSVAETPTDLAVPMILEEMVIEYAALKYRIQDEEPAQYKMYIETWEGKLKLMYSIPATEMEG